MRAMRTLLLLMLVTIPARAQWWKVQTSDSIANFARREFWPMRRTQEAYLRRSLGVRFERVILKSSTRARGKAPARGWRRRTRLSPASPHSTPASPTPCPAVKAKNRASTKTNRRRRKPGLCNTRTNARNSFWTPSPASQKRTVLRSADPSMANSSY